MFIFGLPMDKILTQTKEDIRDRNKEIVEKILARRTRLLYFPVIKLNPSDLKYIKILKD